MQIELPRSLSHAYLISGGTHDSRLEAAKLFSKAYLCEKGVPPCGTCRACHKVETGIHPDVIVVGPEKDKKSITVDQARSLRSDAYIRPNEGKRKVYIIDPADALQPESQGALLKVLEEGPPYAAFLLLTAEAGLMLETIRSRCEPFVLPPAQEEVDPMQLAKAKDLASCLIRGDEFAVMKALVGLEQSKLSLQELNQLLLLTENCLSDHILENPTRAARVLQTLKTARYNAVYNVSAGPTLGWISAEIFR